MATLSADKPLSIAILAMGGQGGGVLADWIIALAESQGWVAQGTSVPGVAQRTGATIYYIETLRAEPGRQPTLSLMPTQGDVDVVIAAELMEAGRSVLRGLVTPERTALIASTHRSYAIAEKEMPADGTPDPAIVVRATDFAARRTIAFDMEELAKRHGSMISAALFGAFAASGALPFSKDQFASIIGSGGKGVEASLRAFADAYQQALTNPVQAPKGPIAKRLDAPPTQAGHRQLDALLGKIATFPATLQPMLFAAVKKLTDYQDVNYADCYLDRMTAIVSADQAHGGADHGLEFSAQTAKYLAIAMAYDDILRVADLKTRATRFARVRQEVGAAPDQIIRTTEYFHPRMEEFCGSLPAALGAWIEASPRLHGWLDRRVNRGRRVRSDSLRWFLALYLIAGMRRFRRRTLRHRVESAHLEQWLTTATGLLARNYALAVEVVACRRLIKGYSDTHQRGISKFDRVLSALPLLTDRADGGDWLKRLRLAALRDEDGVALESTLKTVSTL